VQSLGRVGGGPVKLLVDVPDDVVLDALEQADVSEEALAIDATATDAVVADALRAFVAIDGIGEVLAERPDIEPATVGGDPE